MAFYSPESIEAIREANDYNDMGQSKPISTEWQLVKWGVRRGDLLGSTYICALCGEETWVSVPADLPEHDCPELGLVDLATGTRPQGI